MPPRHRGHQGHRRGEAGRHPGRRTLNRAAVTAAYAAQGLGYAVVVTSLPALKERQSVDDIVVTAIVLGVALFAAAGSVIANAVAVRSGSRTALVLGLALQGLALPLIAVPTPFPVFVAAFAVFGTGLGCVDAASAMQGVAVQRAAGRPLLGGFFAALTAAAIAGALLVSAVAATATATGIALVVAGAIALLIAGFGIRGFARDVPVDEALPRAERGILPRGAIWTFGLVILAAFVVDSAVSTWSAVYLQDGLAAAAWLAPLGYAAYQGLVLVARLVTDRLLPRFGRARLVAVAVTASAVGCSAVALVPSAAVAVAGFALAGLATGILVPVAFGAAGDAAPLHADQVIARVNIFNYAGAILGAVGVGVLAEGTGLGPAFVVPAAVLLIALVSLPRFRRAAVESTVRAASAPR
ncbi:MFS transporter [Microbacter sp. GSS18]|nr:MFS transporter [Microbacter sp. GSS18]